MKRTSGKLISKNLWALLLVLSCLAVVHDSAWAGNVSGKTFASSKYAQLKITVPDEWKISDVEDEDPVNEYVFPVAEFKRLKAIGGSKPSATIQAIKVQSTAENFTNDLKRGLENNGIEIQAVEKLSADSKDVFQLIGMARSGMTKSYLRFQIFGGENYIFQVIYNNDVDDSAYEAEIRELVSSFKWQ